MLAVFYPEGATLYLSNTALGPHPARGCYTKFSIACCGLCLKGVYVKLGSMLTCLGFGWDSDMVDSFRWFDCISKKTPLRLLSWGRYSLPQENLKICWVIQ